MIRRTDVREEPGTGVGSSPQRRDAIPLVTGRGRYLDDLKWPGLLHIAIVRSEVPHGLIRTIDTSAASRVAGVIDIVTGADMLDVDPIPHYIDPALYGGKHLDIRCLAYDEVHYVGHAVAAVLATDPSTAHEAAAQVAVGYEALPHVLDALDAIQVGSPRTVSDWPDNVVVEGRLRHGNYEAAATAADGKVSGSFSIPRLLSSPIETRGYAANWDAAAERLTFYGTCQNPHPLRSVLSHSLGLAENRIRVIVPTLGGAFGVKMDGHPEEVLVAALARRLVRPVKWVETRAEAMLVGAREQTHEFTAVFDGSGRITGLLDSIIANVGAPAALPGWTMARLAAVALPGGYAIPSVDIRWRAVTTNKPPWNAARGYGKESATVVMEHIVDSVAAELSLDPLTVRLRNLVTSDRFPYRTATGLNLDSGHYDIVINKAAELADYAGWRERQAADKRPKRRIGIGMAFEVTPEGGGIPGTLVADYDTSTVRVDPSGKVTVLTGVTSPGGGNDTGICQVVSEELGVPLRDVAIIQGDTDLCPYGFGNYTGRGILVGASSAALAAREVRAKILDIAAEMLHTTVEELSVADGTVVLKPSPERSLTVREVSQAFYTSRAGRSGDLIPPLESTRSYRPGNINHEPDAEGRRQPYPSYSNGAYFVVVEVDIETGKPDLMAVAVVHDCGNMINPELVEGQTLGGTVMGVGAALSESVSFDDRGGVVGGDFKHYMLPRSLDLPWIQIGHHTTPSPFTLLGTKGAGEAGVGGAAAAIANAVQDAVRPHGAHIDALPLTAPRVWRYLAAARSPR